MASFAWNLQALKGKGALEEALACKLERIESAKSADKAEPLGGALAAADDIWDGRTPRPDGKPIATLATSWLAALQHGCIQPKSKSYYACNNGSRIAYALALMLCVGIAIGTFAQPKLWDNDVIDWFGWAVFGIIAFSEVLFLYVRISGRCGQWKESRHTGIKECLQSLIHRTPFGEVWVAACVTILNVLASVLFLFGFSTIIVQMTVDPDFDADLAFVPYEYRETWRAMWTLAFVFVVFSLTFAALLDPSRFGDLRSVHYLLLEAYAWRTLLLGVVAPIIGFGFALYCSVCCSGNYYY